MTKKHSYLTLVAFVLSAFFATAQMQMPSDKAGGSKAQSSGQKTLTGIVSDSMCGAKHMASDKSPAECTRMCVKQGMKYALVAGNKVYTLEGHETELDKLAGEKATVKGTVNGETVTVESVAPATKLSK